MNYITSILQKLIIYKYLVIILYIPHNLQHEEKHTTKKIIILF